MTPSLSPRFLLAGVLFTMVSAAFASVAGKSGWISTGEARTLYYVSDSGRPGPTVLVVSGLHGDEPAGPCAADQIRDWVPSRGRLIVLPRASRPAIKGGTRLTPAAGTNRLNFNRLFPPAPSTAEILPLARDLWEFIREQRPDWVVDLHEGSDFRAATTNSVGSSVIASASPAAVAGAGAVLTALNHTVALTNRAFVLLRNPIKGSLARAVADELNIPTLIIETTSRSQPVAFRARQHRFAVAALLRHLDMAGHQVKPESVLTPNLLQGRPSVALYDGAGNGGKGVARVLAQAGVRTNLLLARVCPEDIRSGALDAFDAVVFTGGSGSGQATALGDAGREAVRHFVRSGGGYTGICAGAYLACSGFSWSLGIIDAKTLSPLWRRGNGTVQLEPAGDGVPMFGKADARFSCLYAQGPIVGPAGRGDLDDYSVLAWFRSEMAANDTPVGIMVNSPAAFAGTYGAGRVLCFSPHPEQSEGLEGVVPRAIDWVMRKSPDARSAKLP